MSVLDVSVTYFDEVDSTNSLLKEMALKGAPCGTAVCAWKQTAGRGRLGRTFTSPEGGIYISMLLPFDETMLLTAKSAVAVRRAIEYSTDIRCDIKWVNDLEVRGRKVCGILAEAVGDKVVLGIGINLCTPVASFPPEIRETAASLYANPFVCDVDACDVVNAVVRNLCEILDEDRSHWLDEYRGASSLIGKTVNVIQASKVTGSGTVLSIDDNAALHVLDKDKGEMILSTGEVSVRLRH